MELNSMIPYHNFHCLHGLEELRGGVAGGEVTLPQFFELHF